MVRGPTTRTDVLVEGGPRSNIVRGPVRCLLKQVERWDWSDKQLAPGWTCDLLVEASTSEVRQHGPTCLLKEVVPCRGSGLSVRFSG